MPQELSTSSPKRAKSNLKPDLKSDQKIERSLSWKVASNLFVSFRYAWAGITYAFKTQRNFRIHCVLGSIVMSLSLLLRLSAVEVAVIALTSSAVLVMELLNTAIESVVDLTVQQNYHELAKIAKDCAAAAVLVSAMASVVIGGFLILPPLMSLIQMHLLP